MKNTTVTVERRAFANALAAMSPDWNIGDASKKEWQKFVHAIQSGELVIVEPKCDTSQNCSS